MKKIIPVEWIESGELDTDEITTQDELIEACGDLLDASCAHDMIGAVLFKAKDGKYYTVTVEAVIAEASKEYVKQTLDEIAAGEAAAEDEDEEANDDCAY